MYLAKNVGGWSTTRIGRFYNGRHHTIVLRAIEKIERLRQSDESLDALIEVITAELSPGTEGCFTERFQPSWTTALIDVVANRVLKEVRRLSLTTEGKLERPLASEQASLHKRRNARIGASERLIGISQENEHHNSEKLTPIMRL